MPRLIQIAIAVALAAALLGCRAAPIQPDTIDTLKPGDVWQGNATLHNNRIALAEFSVEFIKAQEESPFGSQPVIKPPIPVAIVGSVAGVGRKTAHFSPELQQTTVNVLLEAFTQEAQSRGLSIQQAILNQNANTKPAAELGAATPINFVSIDTGRVLTTSIVGHQAAALLVTPAALARRDINTTNNADPLAIRFRAGVYRGRVSLNEGAVAASPTPQGPATLKSKRSLLSDEFPALAASTDRVDPTAFEAGLRQIAPHAARLLFDRLLD